MFFLIKLLFFTLLSNSILLFINSVNINDCTMIINENTNNRYLFCDHKEKWNDAKNFCNNNEGTLLTISDLSESNWIYNKRQNSNLNSDVWVGLITTDLLNWNWINHESGYINWKPGTPDGFRIINCARLLPSSKYLNDKPCYKKYDFICKLNPFTSTPTSTITSTPTSTITSTPTITRTTTPTTTRTTTPTTTRTTTSTTTLTSTPTTTRTTTLTSTPTTTLTITLTSTPTTTLTSTPTTTLTTTLTSTYTTTYINIQTNNLLSSLSNSSNIGIIVGVIALLSIIIGIIIYKKKKTNKKSNDKLKLLSLLSNEPIIFEIKNQMINEKNEKNILINEKYNSLNKLSSESDIIYEEPVPISDTDIPSNYYNITEFNHNNTEIETNNLYYDINTNISNEIYNMFGYLDIED